MVEFISFYVCGDTHGHIDLSKLATKRFKEGKTLTKNDYVLICGDCGVVWDLDSKYDEYIQEWYTKKKKWTTLFVDGNHENHDALDKYPVVDWNGGKVHKITDSLIHLMRGQVYTIDGHKIFTMGGAESHDKWDRKEGVSWWARELPSKTEYETALTNLEKHNNKVDYIFSHCASKSIQSLISSYYENNPLTSFLELVEQYEFKHWFFGHYHIDKRIDEKHTALYDQIIKLW